MDRLSRMFGNSSSASQLSMARREVCVCVCGGGVIDLYIGTCIYISISQSVVGLLILAVDLRRPETVLCWHHLTNGLHHWP